MSLPQLGPDIDGEAANDTFGNGMILSSDGSIVAIGAGGNDGYGEVAGDVGIFEYMLGMSIVVAHHLMAPTEQLFQVLLVPQEVLTQVQKALPLL